ncbi:MAG: HIT family hydrolase, partial [Ignavibacteria bacterium]|nr:HIT family hydrolase [Ignavibacteria bacterium]
MQKLFSPWRSEYIESFQAEKSGECVFCSSAKEEPEDENSLVVHKAKSSFVIMNKYPYNNGHLLI